MPSTMEDFWRMVTEHNICTMVQLNSPSVVSYWDESDNAGSQISFGSLQVTLKTKETMPSYIKREFVVYNTKVEEEVCIRDLETDSKKWTCQKLGYKNPVFMKLDDNYQLMSW